MFFFCCVRILKKKKARKVSFYSSIFFPQEKLAWLFLLMESKPALVIAK